MKCPECQAEGERSTVHAGAGFSTCMGYDRFWDEDGAYHSHDPNITTTSYRCSRGHSWPEEQFGRCPAEGCDWGSEHEAQVKARRAARYLATRYPNPPPVPQ
jgi:hypothetical protein